MNQRLFYNIIFLYINIFKKYIVESFKINKKIIYSCRYKSLTYVNSLTFYNRLYSLRILTHFNDE